MTNNKYAKKCWIIVCNADSDVFDVDMGYHWAWTDQESVPLFDQHKKPLIRNTLAEAKQVLSDIMGHYETYDGTRPEIHIKEYFVPPEPLTDDESALLAACKMLGNYMNEGDQDFDIINDHCNRLTAKQEKHHNYHAQQRREANG